MPKDKYGDRDRHASDALRNILPKNWKLKSPRDSDSGSEVCQDWVVEILDKENEWTGAEFSVQNKTNPKVYNDYVSTIISVDCVCYLLDKVTRPILIHAYAIELESSYWIWLSEWERLSDRKKWQSQKEVSIQIPIANLLTIDSIESIQKTVYETHFKTTVRQKYDLENKLNPDFNLTPPIFKGDNVYSVAIPKHNNAKFNISMDEKNQKIFQQSMDYGEIKSIKVNSTDFPLVGIRENEELELTIIPYSLSHEPPINVKFIGSNGNVIFEQFFQLKNVQNGAMFQKWRSKFIKKPVFFNLNIDNKTQDITCNLELDKDVREPKFIQWYLELVKKLKLAKIIRIQNLQTDETHESNFDGEIQLDNKMDEQLIEFINQLALISEKLKIEFEIPDKISSVDMMYARIITEIITTGYTSDINIFSKIARDKSDTEELVLIVEMFSFDAEKFTKDMSENNFVYIPTGVVNLDISLLNHKISLDSGEGFVYSDKILSSESISNELSSEDLTKIVFSIKNEKYLVRYPEWINDKNQ